jgi:hypothetical protein
VIRAIDAYEFDILGRKGVVRRLLIAILWSFASSLTNDSLAAYNIRVRDRRSQEVLGLIEAGDDPGAASALLDLLVERAHELTPFEFLAYYHLGDEA